MSSVHNTANKFDKWCRLVILIEEGGLSLCKDILHQRMHVPTEGQGIYKYLQRYRLEIEKYKLQAYQEKILLPDDGVIDKKQLNLPLYTYIIQILDKTQNYPLIAKLRQKRNELFHAAEGKIYMKEQLFNEHWDKISQLLASLHYNVDLIKSLKTEDCLSQEYKKTLENIARNMKGSMELSWVSTSVIYYL